MKYAFFCPRGCLHEVFQVRIPEQHAIAHRFSEVVSTLPGSGEDAERRSRRKEQEEGEA